MILTIVAAIVIGLTLGIFGSGGAIIALPSFMYVLQFTEKQAVIASLAVVAIISFVNTLLKVYAKQIDVKATISFLVPGLLGSYLGAFIGAGVDARYQMYAFVVLMVIAAVKMLRNSQFDCGASREPARFGIVVFVGLAVGLATGFVGVGGGFLIVPALMVFLKFTAAKAISSSVFVILFQTITALIGYRLNSSAVFVSLDWQAVLLVATVGTLGSVFGVKLSKNLNEALLTKTFAVFLLLMSVMVSALNV